MNRKQILFCSLLLLTGCAARQRIVYPTVSSYVESADFVKYRNLAVLPFTDAPGAQYSGQIVAASVSQALTEVGFISVERARLQELLREQWISASGILSPTKTIELGRILGVRALVMGEVGQYETLSRKTDTTYIPITNFYTGKTVYYPQQGQQWLDGFVSMSLRVVDVETGGLVYSATGSIPEGVRNPPQEVAGYIAREVVAKWLGSPGMLGLDWDGQDVVTQVIWGMPAQKNGVKVGDKILKWNGKELAGLSQLERLAITWGKPGETVEIKAERNGKPISFVATRVPR